MTPLRNDIYFAIGIASSALPPRNDFFNSPADAFYPSRIGHLPTSHPVQIPKRVLTQTITSKILAVYKPLGLSSHRMAMDLSEKLGDVVTHTGNLDPMAEGVMVFLIGEDRFRYQAQWQQADKEYVFDVMFGFSTDSYDQLGLVDELKSYTNEWITYDKLKPVICELEGHHQMPRPVYSYKLIHGKPLYWWARQGRLKEIKIPKVDVTIKSAHLIGVRRITKAALGPRIKKNIARVMGDFRQEAIHQRWERALSLQSKKSFTVAKIKIVCSKGTYVRSIAHQLGQTLGIPALTWRIVRARVGPVQLSDCSPVSKYNAIPRNQSKASVS